MFDVRVRYKKKQSRENVDVFCLGFKKVIYLGFGKGDKKKRKKYARKKKDATLITHLSFQNA